MLTEYKILNALADNSIACKEISHDLNIEVKELVDFLKKEYVTLARIYIDGGARGNPGEAGAGVVLENARQKDGYFFYIDRTTNNVAEYTALYEGLKLALKNDIKNVKVYTDSELVCKQIKGEYKVRSNHLVEIYNNCSELILKMNSFEITHIPREQNREADRLVNIAIDSKQNGKIELTVAGS